MRSKLLLLLLACCTLLTAQENYQYVFHHKHGRVNDMAVDQGRLAVAGSEASCRQPTLSFFNAEGVLQWSEIVNDCGYCKVDDVEFANNGDLLVGGNWQIADDYPDIQDGVAVARYDTLGNRLAYQKMAHYFTENPVCILELPNGEILAGGDNYLFGFNSQLDSLFTREYPMLDSPFREMLIVDDTTLAFCTNRRIYLGNYAGDFRDTIVAPGSFDISDLVLLDDKLLFVKYPDFYIYDLTTDFLGEIPLPPGARQGILLNAERVFIWGETLYQLTPQSTWDLAYQFWNSEKTNKKIINENEVFYRGGEDALEIVTGDPYYLNARLGFAERFVPTPADTMQATPTEDIGVTDVQMLELISQNVYEDFPGLYLISFKFRFGVEVTNFGDTEVSSFSVISEKFGNFNCAEGRHFAFVDEVLLPGESKFVEGELTRSFYSEGNMNPSISLEMCFFTGGPNHRFDLDFSNNRYCGLILVDTEELHSDINLQLYPNPATELLHVVVNPSHPIEAYTWINVAGQVISSQKVAPTSNLELPRPGPTGMYFLQVMSDQGSTVQRVIWRQTETPFYLNRKTTSMRSKLILLLLTFSTLLSAQENYQYVFQQKHGRVNDLAISDGRVVAGGSEQACANPMIALMNRDGSLAWEVTPYECGYCRVNDVEFAGNGDILLGGIFKEADDVGTFVDGLAVARFDTFGNRLAFQQMYWYPFFDPVSILELPNGNIVAGGNKYLFGFNSELDSLFTKIYDFTNSEALIAIKMLNDSSLVLPTEERILLTDLQGQIQQEIPAPSGGHLVDLEVWGDSLLFMNSGVLYFYDVATADLSSVNLPQTARKGIILNQDTVMVWGETVHRLDDNGEWQLVTAPDNNEKSNLTVGYDQGIVYRAGTMYLEPDLGQPSYYRRFQDGFLERITTLANPPPPVKDLGLTGVYNVELISHTPYEDGPGFFANKYRIKFGLEVMNFGDLPVQSCVVGSEVLGAHNCSEGRFFAIDSTLILPGESIIVEGETTEIRYSDSPNPTVTFERCFFVGAPDHEFDLNFDNNYNCGVIFVDTKDLEDNLNLQLYPNPATDLLQVVVNPQHPIEAYTWINAAGQVISSQKVAPTGKLELTRPGPAGMYFLKVVSQGKTAVKRINWQ